jgi:DNA-binding transcriptional regulator YhcF (GntR family)
MPITVMVRQPLRLTYPQVQLLRFFAGEEGPPRLVIHRTYEVLEAHGLIKQQRGRRRSVISALGQQVLDEIDRRAMP